jgi:DNA polymerase-3 subunit gamma/tau
LGELEISKTSQHQLRADQSRRLNYLSTMALYHTHRPQTFDSIIGQDHIVKTITNQIKTGKVAHAYLFSGPRGIGKTTTARLLAKALNCENRKENKYEPCNSCNSCSEISGSRSIDVIEVDAASHTGVDNVRENIIENAQFRPTKSPYKIFIIDEVHMLSTSSFNALLKTLEEPPTHVIFILATTESHKLPETILSRCQRYNFKKVAYDVLAKHLQAVAKEEKVKIDKEVLDRIINKSDGCVRDAIGLLDQIMATGEKEITPEIASIVLPASNLDEVAQFISFLINHEAKEGLEILNNLAEQGIRFTQFADDTIELLRVLMIVKATGQKTAPGVDLNDKIIKELHKLGGQIEYLELVKLIDIVMKRRQEIQSAPLPQLPLELVVIEWCADDTNHKAHITSHEPHTEKTETDKNKTSIPDNNVTIEQFNNQSQSTTQKIAEKVKNLIIRDKEPVCSVEDVEAKWPELLSAINGDSPSLTFILKTANIAEISGNTICLSVAYRFHKDKLECKKCRRQIEEILSKLLDKKMEIDIMVQEKGVVEADSKEIEELATTLGGTVVS